MAELLVCRICRAEFHSDTTRKRVYCSDECKNKGWLLQKGEPEGLCPITSGSWRELAVAIDLIRSKFEVFRSLCSSFSCDLVVRKVDQSKLWRVEVTAGRRTLSGKIVYTPHNKTKFDVLAVVFKDSTITYIPDIKNI